MVTLHVKYDGETTLYLFYVIDLGSDSMLLGMPFLAATNPDINWGQGIFRGEITAVTTISKRVQPLEGIIWVQDVYKHFSKNQRPFN